MKIYTHTLDINKFKKDFSSFPKIRGREDKELVLNDVIARIEVVKSNIVDFLKDVDNIEDTEVQECCRRAAIAQMYHTKLSHREGYPYIIKQNKWVLLIQHQTRCFQDSNWMTVYSTAIVSKYGEIIINEGEINVSTGTDDGWGCKAMNVQTGKMGFISNYGDLLIPYIFDRSFSAHNDQFVYKGIRSFKLRVFGKQSRHVKEMLNELLDPSELPDYIICRSEKGVLASLRVEEGVYEYDTNCCWVPNRKIDPIVFQEALKEVKDLMTPYTISTDELKKLLNS